MKANVCFCHLKLSLVSVFSFVVGFVGTYTGQRQRSGCYGQITLMELF